MCWTNNHCNWVTKSQPTGSVCKRREPLEKKHRPRPLLGATDPKVWECLLVFRMAAVHPEEFPQVAKLFIIFWLASNLITGR